MSAYRIFDVDDLLLNSTGALFGFLLAPILLALFPSKESVLSKAIDQICTTLITTFSYCDRLSFY